MKNKEYLISIGIVVVLALLTILLPQSQPEDDLFGATLPVAGTTYNLAGSGVSSSASSITLQSFTIPQTGQKISDSDLSDTFYLTIEPGNRTRQEIVSCTTVTQNSGGTATFSGCSRGLSPITPYTASTTLQFSHAGGAQVILSDPPQLFNEFASKQNDQQITGAWGFGTVPSTTDECTEDVEFCTKSYIDNSVNQGAATSTESIGGIVELATEIEVASSTASTANKPLVIQAQNATSTPGYSCDNSGTSGALCIPVAENNGLLNASWIQGQTFNWSGSNIFTGNFIVNNASSTFGNINISGNATTTGNVVIGTNSFAAPTSSLSVIGNSYLQGTATITADLVVLGSDGCVGCNNAARKIDGTPAALNTSNGQQTSATVSCNSNEVLVSGGFHLTDPADSGNNYHVGTSTVTSLYEYTATVECATASSCPSGTLTAHAICIPQ